MKKKVKKKKRKIDLMRLKFIKALGNPNVKTIADAARIAGYKEGARNVYRKNTRKHIEDVMEDMGLTDEKLLNPIKDAMVANKAIGYIHQYKQQGKDGKIEKAKPDECMSNDFLEYPDHPTRLKAAELGLKAKGKLTDKVKLLGDKDNPIGVIFTKEYEKV